MVIQSTSRRELLFHALPTCATCAMFSGFLSQEALAAPVRTDAVPLDKRTTAKADMSYADIFRFSYASMIPVMQKLCNEIGREKALALMKESTYATAFQRMASNVKNVPASALDLPTFLSNMRNPNALYQHVLTYEMLKDSKEEGEFRVTECLWARTFRNAGAGDIGYALVCHSDVGTIDGYNRQIAFNRPRVLMNGDDECRFIYRMRA